MPVSLTDVQPAGEAVWDGSYTGGGCGHTGEGRGHTGEGCGCTSIGCGPLGEGCGHVVGGMSTQVRTITCTHNGCVEWRFHDQ